MESLKIAVSPDFRVYRVDCPPGAKLLQVWVRPRFRGRMGPKVLSLMDVPVPPELVVEVSLENMRLLASKLEPIPHDIFFLAENGIRPIEESLVLPVTDELASFLNRLHSGSPLSPEQQHSETQTESPSMPAKATKVAKVNVNQSEGNIILSFTNLSAKTQRLTIEIVSVTTGQPVFADDVKGVKPPSCDYNLTEEMAKQKYDQLGVGGYKAKIDVLNGGTEILESVNVEFVVEAPAQVETPAAEKAEAKAEPATQPEPTAAEKPVDTTGLEAAMQRGAVASVPKPEIIVEGVNLTISVNPGMAKKIGFWGKAPDGRLAFPYKEVGAPTGLITCHVRELPRDRSIELVPGLYAFGAVALSGSGDKSEEAEAKVNLTENMLREVEDRRRRLVDEEDEEPLAGTAGESEGLKQLRMLDKLFGRSARIVQEVRATRDEVAALKGEISGLTKKLGELATAVNAAASKSPTVDIEPLRKELTDMRTALAKASTTANKPSPSKDEVGEAMSQVESVKSALGGIQTELKNLAQLIGASTKGLHEQMKAGFETSDAKRSAGFNGLSEKLDTVVSALKTRPSTGGGNGVNAHGNNQNDGGNGWWNGIGKALTLIILFALGVLLVAALASWIMGPRSVSVSGVTPAATAPVVGVSGSNSRLTVDVGGRVDHVHTFTPVKVEVSDGIVRRRDEPAAQEPSRSPAAEPAKPSTSSYYPGKYLGEELKWTTPETAPVRTVPVQTVPVSTVPVSNGYPQIVVAQDYGNGYLYGPTPVIHEYRTWSNPIVGGPQFVLGVGVGALFARDKHYHEHNTTTINQVNSNNQSTNIVRTNVRSHNQWLNHNQSTTVTTGGLHHGRPSYQHPVQQTSAPGGWGSNVAPSGNGTWGSNVVRPPRT